MRCAQRNSMHRSEGAMETPLNRKYNPWGGVAPSTISRFHAETETTGILEQLLALSTWPAKPYDFVHTNDKAWTHYYFDKLPGSHPKKDEPRLFTLAQVLWSHRYNLVVAARIQRGYFGDTFPGDSLLDCAPVLMDVQTDPTDTVACRAHAASGAKSLRSRFRGKLMCQTETGQRNEFLTMAIAYNLSRLVTLQLREKIDIHFQHGAQILAARTT